MLSLHPRECMLLIEIDALQRELARLEDPERRAPREAALLERRAALAALEAELLPSKLASLRRERSALDGPAPRVMRVLREKRLAEIESAITALEAEAARLGITVTAAG